MERSPANIRDMTSHLTHAVSMQCSGASHTDCGAIEVENDAFPAANGRLEVGNRKGNLVNNCVCVGDKRKHSDLISEEDVVVKEEVVETPRVRQRVAVVEDSETESEGGDEEQDQEAAGDEGRVEGSATPPTSEEQRVEAAMIESEDMLYDQAPLGEKQRVEEAREPRLLLQSPLHEPVSSSVLTETDGNSKAVTSSASVEGIDCEDRRAERQVVVERRRKKAQQAKPRAKSPQIELPADQELMTVVLAHEWQFEGASYPRSMVWESITRECGSRFQLTSGAQARVRWLVTVWLDPAHRLHAHMGEPLTARMQKYSDNRLKRGEPLAYALSKTLKNSMVSESIEDTGAGSGRGEKDERFPSAPKRSGFNEAVVDCDLEEKIAAIVLEFAPRFPTATCKDDVWKLIAKASRGRYETSSRAKTRTRWLCTALSNPKHERYNQISQSLRQSLAKIMDYVGWECQEQKQTKQVPTASADVIKQTHCDEECSNEAAQDELLVRLYLEKRFFAQPKSTRARQWSEIVKVLKNPVIKDAQDGIRRVRFLVRAFENSTNEHHTKLTPELRVVLAKCVAEVAAFEETLERGELDEETNNSEGPAGCGGEASPDAPSMILPEPVLRRSTRARKPARPLQHEESGFHNTGTASEETDSTKAPPATIPCVPPMLAADQESDTIQPESVVASLLVEVSELKHTQRRQRDKLHSLVKMLQDEREFHRQQTMEMLQLVRTEREDRKHEFATLMERFTGPGS